MSDNTTYLITGASRGIGKGFVAYLLARSSVTVVAAVRDPAKATIDLDALPKGAGSRLIVVKLDSTVEADAAVAVKSLQSDHGITSLDVVIANAGIADSSASVLDTSAASIHSHFQTNTFAPIFLYQATAPLLKASVTGRPIFLVISTAMGSIAMQPQLAGMGFPGSPYGASKAALNWFVARAAAEEKWLTAFAVHPGSVTSDMGSRAMEKFGIEPEAVGAISVETSVEGMLEILDNLTAENSGKFLQYDGKDLPW